VEHLEILKKIFREGSKNFEVAQLILENKSFDEIKEIIPKLTKKTVYDVRSRLKNKGVIGKTNVIILPPKVLDEASQENRIRTLNQLLLKKPNEQSREEIEAIAEELGVKPEFLENLIEEKAKMETDKDGVNVTKKKNRRSQLILRGRIEPFRPDSTEAN